MKKPSISINMFTEFSTSTDTRKLSIIKSQIKPSKFIIQRYASAKSSIKKYLKNVSDLNPIYEGIDKQINRQTTTNWQKNDRQVSIEALQKFVTLKIARALKGIKYEVIKPDVKLVNINDVDITVSPELIIKMFLDGKVVYGGIKIHIAKTKPFTSKQCSYAATVLCEYIKANVMKRGENVDPKLCLSIDVFGERIVPASEKYTEELNEIRELCLEVKKIWNKVA
jgi:hypothetical protein